MGSPLIGVALRDPRKNEKEAHFATRILVATMPLLYPADMPELPAWRIGPVLGVRDVKKAVAYYTDILGFECPGGIFEGAAPGEGGVYAVVRRQEIEIHLQIRRRDIYAGAREDIESDTYVFVQDADALCQEFQAKGAVILRGVQDEPYGLRDFVVEDPEGHRLVFGAPLG